jgi:ATP-binding cassette subfamily B protein
LVFDEATSALDSKSEQAIQTQLNEIAQNRTTLIIAHRLSTILHAHQILVLDQGRIVECGRHEELMRQGGLYFQMWQRQEAAQKQMVLVEEGGV